MTSALPPELQKWKIPCSWTSPASSGAQTATFTLKFMAISSSDALTKATAQCVRLEQYAPMTYGTPALGW